MGWAVVFSGKAVLTKIPKAGLIYLLGGGLLYTFGVIFYRMKQRKYSHFIWHLFVLGEVFCIISLYYFIVVTDKT